jgi:hypothetical protein
MHITVFDPKGWLLFGFCMCILTFAAAALLVQDYKYVTPPPPRFMFSETSIIETCFIKIHGE